MPDMNSYTFDEIELEQTEQFEVEITAEKMELFCQLSGDVSPIHLDASYAKQRGYEGRVVYGMLVASFFSTLAGTYLPGEHCLLHSVSSKFAKPVLIGDVLTISGTVTEKHDLFKEVTLKAKVVNQHGKTVCRGEIKAGVAQ